jgi:PKD repeat protein
MPLETKRKNMFKKTFLFSAVTVFVGMMIVATASSPCYAQWARTYSGLSLRFGNSVQQTVDGGLVFAGHAGAFDYSFCIFKVNSAGNIDWAKRGAPAHLRSMSRTHDGGFVAAGRAGLETSEALVFKLSPDGNFEWQNTWRGGAGGHTASAIQETFDQSGNPNGYIVAGEFCVSWNWIQDYLSDFDIWIQRLDLDGRLVWQKTYGGDYRDAAYSVQQTTDGGYIVAGQTLINADIYGLDAWILKLDAYGAIAWQKAYGGSNIDKAQSVQQTNDGGYIVVGETCSFGLDNHSFWVLKLNSDGSIAWQKAYGGFQAQSVQQTLDGGYIVAGSASGEAWILKLNPDGTIDWERTFGGDSTDWASFVRQTADGGYVVTGHTYSFSEPVEMLALKLDINGGIPDCTLMGTNNPIVTDTWADDVDTSVPPQTSPGGPGFEEVSFSDALLQMTQVCGASPPELPTAHFSAVPTSGPTPLNVNFADETIGIVDTWSWDFDGDGTVDSTVQSPSHTYTTPGMYTVTLTVSSSGGSDSETKIDYITVTGSTAPVIDKLFRRRREPGAIVAIVGSNFGTGNPGDYVRIGGTELPYGHKRIRLWSPTKIRVRIPKRRYVRNGCAWFKEQDSRKVKVWVNIEGTDSNVKRLTVLKPVDCL